MVISPATFKALNEVIMLLMMTSHKLILHLEEKQTRGRGVRDVTLARRTLSTNTP